MAQLRIIFASVLFFCLTADSAELVKTIGTSSRDYSTIQAWEDDLDDGTNAANDATAYQAADTARGDVYNDSVFDENVLINGGSTIGLTAITLTVPVSERHDGTAGTGARIVKTDSGTVLTLNSSVNTFIEWLEIHPDDTGAAVNEDCSGIQVVGSGDAKVDHVIIHDSTSTIFGVATHGIRVDFNQQLNVANSIIYGMLANGGGSSAAGHGILSQGGSARVIGIRNVTCVFVTDTCYWMNNSNTGTTLITNSIGMDAGEDFDVGVWDTGDYCLDSDNTAPGGNSVNLKASADQFVDNTNDFHLKAGADAIDQGDDLGTTPADIEFDIDNEDRDTLAVTWDIGADELVGASAPGQQVIRINIMDF